MNIRKEKTSITSLIGLTDNETFTNAQVLRDIVDAVEPMHNLATRKVEEDGIYAKVYADHVAERLAQIFKLANNRLSAVVESAQEKALNNIA